MWFPKLRGKSWCFREKSALGVRTGEAQGRPSRRFSVDEAGRSGKAQAGEDGKEMEPKVKTMYFQSEKSSREGHDGNEKGGGQEAVRIENKLEERNPEPESLQ